MCEETRVGSGWAENKSHSACGGTDNTLHYVLGWFLLITLANVSRSKKTKHAHKIARRRPNRLPKIPQDGARVPQDNPPMRPA